MSSFLVCRHSVCTSRHLLLRYRKVILIHQIIYSFILFFTMNTIFIQHFSSSKKLINYISLFGIACFEICWIKTKNPHVAFLLTL